MNRIFRSFPGPIAGVIASLVLAVVALAEPPTWKPSLTLAPYHASGIYASGEIVGWSVTPAPGEEQPNGGYTYTVKRDGAVVIKSGRIEPGATATKIEAILRHPGMVFLEIVPTGGEGHPVLGGAAVDPLKIQPDVARPADFDAFWAEKIKMLQGIPMEPVETPGASERPGVDYETVRLNNVFGAHVYGQLAKPARPGKFPAMLIMQWASPPYPLQKAWVTDRAAEGWLAFNVEPHDVPCDLPSAFYAALPTMIKEYRTIYNDDRDRNYFLQMYLGDYRALEYLAGRPDWDGRILVATGTSMGGQQSYVVAALCPQVTHMIVDVPAGADANAARHDRAEGYPNWDQSNPKVMETARYFDTVNFASRIKAKSLAGIGFVDTTCPPVGCFTAFNQIQGPKEVVPLRDSPHNHLATPEQQRPYVDRSNEWLAELARGEEPVVNAQAGVPAAP